LTFFPEASFIRERCTGCRACLEVCPTGAVTLHDGIPKFEGRICIGCGHCGAWCPENCHGLEPVPVGPFCSPENFRQLAASRRSIRHFSTEELSDVQLEELLSVVRYCPTGVNAQGITVVAWRGEAVRRELFAPIAALLRRLRFTGLPWLAGLLSGRGRVITRIAGGEDLVFCRAPLVLFFFVPRGNPTGQSDGVIAAATVMHQAGAMGLGTLWNGVARALYPLMRGWHTAAPRGGRLTAVLCAGTPFSSPGWLVPGRDWTLVTTGSTAGSKPVTAGDGP
jgi:nitroreductase/NAD-dependent dihydropyrimidine dehydrogenase PreA subunit